MKGCISSVSAFFSSACCVGPVVLGGLGIGASTVGFLGGVAGFVKALVPFQAFFIAGAVIFLGLNFYAVYGAKCTLCLDHSTAGLKKRKKEIVLLWTNTVMVLLFILSPYILATL